ncbi:hypothetical protein FORC066_1847 [Yersinia enterocolitica]|nr:hypothetical protein FORC066_1847 [Yersinia enterocolitica]
MIKPTVSPQPSLIEGFLLVAKASTATRVDPEWQDNDN